MKKPPEPANSNDLLDKMAEAFAAAMFRSQRGLVVRPLDASKGLGGGFTVRLEPPE